MQSPHPSRPLVRLVRQTFSIKELRLYYRTESSKAFGQTIYTEPYFSKNPVVSRTVLFYFICLLPWYILLFLFIKQGYRMYLWENTDNKKCTFPAQQFSYLCHFFHSLLLWGFLGACPPRLGFCHIPLDSRQPLCQAASIDQQIRDSSELLPQLREPVKLKNKSITSLSP